MNQMNNMNNLNFINNMNQMNNMNNFMMQNINFNNNNRKNISNNQVTICFRKHLFNDNDEIKIQCLLDEKVGDIIQRYKYKSQDYDDNYNIYIFNGKKLNESLSLAESGIGGDSIISVFNTKHLKGGGSWYYKIINIKFIKVSKNNFYKNDNQEIIGLLKLCLLKEISKKISEDELKKLPDLICYIMNILSLGYIPDDPGCVRKNIMDVLKKTEGSSIINFSNYVDEIIDANQLNKILSLVKKYDLKKILDLKYRLSRYNKCIKLFNQEFIKSLKESIFEFSIISMVIIEREDYDIFETERKKCPNRVDKILYHGTSIEPISSILTGIYRKSLENHKAINGKGVYFTNLLDYGWYYGGEGGNRANFSGIPKVDDTFTVIVNSVYYDKNGFQQVKDNKRTPGKNQVNFAFAGAKSERLIIPDKNKFLASEYVIYDLDQICPFMSIKLKRDEFCVIWRDDNFSSKPIWNSEWDEKFKSFLKERMKYINQNANFNIYPCETTEEALELVKRKKYNKIILISNVGKDYGGRTFIDKARVILRNNVITLFLAYKKSHLDWITKYKNALFSNEPKFYEEYLECFDNKYIIEDIIEKLIKKMEKHYNVKFNFDDNYLKYPLFKNDGKYGDLRFD